MILATVAGMSVDTDTHEHIDPDGTRRFGASVIDTRGRLGDTAGGLGDTAFYIGDGLHPNALGHRVLADRVAAAVAPRLGIALSSTAAL